MQKLFFPESVVVIGVSDSPTNLGRRIIENLQRFNFGGRVHAVGLREGSLGDKRVYSNVGAVDDVPDVAVFLTPADSVPGFLEQCGEKGIRYAVVESGGFSEYADAGRHLEKKVLEIACRWGMRVVGPNCIGIINMDNGMSIPLAYVEPEMKRKGVVSLMTQSGGVILDALKHFGCENIGFSKLISMGNKLDLNENDYLSYLVQDQGTRIIGMHLEGVADGRKLMEIGSRTHKPIVAIKGNTSDAGKQIARFHTAALAGDSEVFFAAMRQAGIHCVKNYREMLNCFKVFSLPLVRGRKLAILCRSGGEAVLAADTARRYGFELARLSEDFFAKVRQGSRSGIIRFTNPLDMGDIFDFEFYIRIVEWALQEEDVDAVLFHRHYRRVLDRETNQKVIVACRDLSIEYDKPVLTCMAADPDEYHLVRATSDYPIFSEPDDAIEALEKSFRHYLNKSSAFPCFGEAKDPRVDVAPTSDVFRTLERYGIPVAPYRIVENVQEGKSAALSLGYPVVLKISSPQIIHKTESGGVLLNIVSEHALEQAFLEMKADAYIVQKMMPSGLEVFIGGKRDRDFGPVVLFGLGGIFVEILKDFAMRVVPIDERAAMSMTEEIKGAPLLRGFRGGPPCDREAVAECLVRVSRMLMENPWMKTLDVNPLIVYPAGSGCVVVDAKTGT